MDASRLANVIFDRGQKITQAHYQQICESIETDRFTLDAYVLDYKLKERFCEKVPYRLDDGTKFLVSESMITKMRNLDMNLDELTEYMCKSSDNMTSIIRILHD